MKRRSLVHSALCVVVLTCITSTGCVSTGAREDIARISLSEIPRELDKVTLPEYRVEPPDILLIEAVTNIRKADSPLRAGDEILIQVANGLPLDPELDPEANPLEFDIKMQFEQEFKIINKTYRVGTNGVVDLGPEYGRVYVIGLDVDQAKTAIESHLKNEVLLEKAKVAVSMPDVAGMQEVSGEHLVRPDGTISLGIHGYVRVTGMTLPQVKQAVEQQLRKNINDPEVNVDVLSYNSKAYYVIVDGGGQGEGVNKFPITGNETVLDAISNLKGLPAISSKKIWIARPAPAGTDCTQILNVHWKEITSEGMTATNYQLLPGDRIYIKADDLRAIDIFVAKVTSPFERIFGTIFLGHGVVRELQFGHIRGGNTRGGGF